MLKQIKRLGQAGGVAIASGVALVGQANAALPSAVTTAMTTLQTDGLAMIDLVWPVVAALVGGFVLIKLFKRGASKI